MKPKKVIKLLEGAGWYEKRPPRGSHHFYIHDEIPGKITVPVHNKDLPAGTLNSILKQAGLK